jgi:cell division protein FtsL
VAGSLQAAAAALSADQLPGHELPPAEPRARTGRPRLRVVDEAARRQQQARQRRARLLVAGAVVTVVGSVFALAASHAYLVSGQSELDRLSVQVEDARSQYSEVRLQVAELGAPDRIVSEAVNRLGMVSSPSVRYLAPSSQLATQLGVVGGSPQTDPGDGKPGASWSSVKPYLGGSR